MEYRKTRFSLLFVISCTGFVAINPGCPAYKGYFDIADLVIVSEHSHHSFVNPPTHEWDFQYLTSANPDHGLKLMLPKPSKPEHIFKSGIINHGFLPGQTHATKMLELRRLVHDLVCVKRVGAVFITDLELEKADIYAQWSSFWPEFIDLMGEAGKEVCS